jgi:hypothetical protein
MIRILWPEIRGAISRGHTLKGHRLEGIGISISYHPLVVGRLCREDVSRLANGTASSVEKREHDARCSGN